MNFLHDAKERQQLAQRLRARQLSIDQGQKTAELESKKRHEDQTWKLACDVGTGTVRISWQDLPRVSDRVYSYKSTYGKDLVHLALDGVNLSSLQKIPEHCKSLRHLSLASNAIDDITGIHHLASLVTLNLLRNKLSTLPTEIGDLVYLKRLEVATNKLSQIPSSIGKLTALTHLNLESNELADLPRDFGRLKCEVLNLNYNNFVSVPDCLMSMKSLMRLSVMGNELTYLPIGLQRFTVLEELRMSRNKINVLPDSIVDVPMLRELWLDHNQLSSLPQLFHRLTKLQVLKLEGNVDMVYPSADVVAKGAEEVLRWSRNRVSRNRVEKVRNIVQSLAEVLSRIQQYEVGGDLHETVFRVVDDHFYQFPPDALWSLLLPELNKFSGGINSFPFERCEVERAIFQFQDAAGSIVKKASSAKFRKCSCVQTGRSPQPCHPSNDGWECTRPALILRMNMVYEENMVEKRRVEAEEKKIAEAVKAAEAIAKKYLTTDDGMMMVRDEAEKRMASSREVSQTSTQPTSSRSRSSFAATMLTIASSLRGSRQSFKAQRKRVEIDVMNEYIDQEVAKGTAKVMEENEKVRRIMKKWVGNSASDAFQGWRDVVQASKKQRRGKARARLRQERRNYENDVALHKLKTLELTKYDEMYDQFNDLPVWVHRDTNETLYDKPTNILTYPDMPKSLLDENGEPLTPRTIARLEASSSSEDESYASSSSQSGEDHSVLSESPREEIDESDSNPSVVELSGRDAELELAKKYVLEKRKSRILEVAAKVKGASDKIY
ncbi:hypothetical protein ACHAXM_011134 [Skeletonema potamos]